MTVSVDLRVLELGGTRITDAGLVHLRGLTNLKMLVLDRTKVTDAGMVHLKGLVNLEELRLQSTAITGADLPRPFSSSSSTVAKRCNRMPAPMKSAALTTPCPST